MFSYYSLMSVLYLRILASSDAVAPVLLDFLL